jgi:hypothetical protein
VTVLAEAPRLVQPAYCHLPEAERTEGDEVAGLCADAGYVPEPEQGFALDAIFAKDRYGKSAATEVWLLGPRQQIKTSVMKMTVLGWAFLFAEDPIIWTAHKWDPPIHEAFLELEQIISGYRWLARQVRYFHRGKRQVEIGLRNGARILGMTRTVGTARSLAGAKTILDEAWAVRDEHVGALIPTLSSRSIAGDPQVLGGSSGARADSEYLHSVISRGRSAATDPQVARLEPDLAYIEYGCPPPERACDRGRKCDHGKDTPGCGCDKIEVVAAGNPALGRRMSEKFARWERRTLPVDEYCRERMNWHEEQPGQAKVIPIQDWSAAQDPASEPDGAVMLSVVYGNDKRSAAIGLAGRRGDWRWHVETADVVAPSLVPLRVREMIARSAGTARPVVAPVAVDSSGYEKECIAGLEGQLSFADAAKMAAMADRDLDPALAAEWPETVEVRKLTGQDVAAAFTGFYTSLTDAHDLCHRGQDGLLLALVGATSRDVGDAGEAWGRRKSGTDIKEIVAVTQARWLWEQVTPEAEAQPGAWAV